MSYKSYWQDFPGGLEGNEFVCSARDLGSVSGLGRSPGEGNVYPLQYSCLENSINKGAWRAAVSGIAESDRTEQLTLTYKLLTGRKMQ